ncbi:hypothetical protein AE581_00825 [Salmonella enterica subsp. enterica serovar Heidelberg]|uniref:Uncharacterized protein n=9 Tax=Salmonella enterica TaxID=28901 RepID=A0A5U8XN24_SALMU|nr:hypothetical protein SEEHRA35_014595 [Salmonella enterica subsp. enterica serovar Heidelberg str. SARA35]AVG30608.1 hypothetical protein RK54_10555 [Salmonella enterica subsp. enterica serovar Heidelberg]EAA4991742.1 hypothetical protein [Salmonella enterica]EAA5413254.1 hypothetical protein [Salmonella enterica subsp. enterica serovar Newport]EAA7576496.1 hypothetical protein [Salmonella enterica subsp. enterica]EAA8311399.1 hypothetical protein [Salmonella enterica subsp. enterica serovar
MANLIPTMGYYACDVTRIKNLASAGFLFFWWYIPLVSNHRGRAIWGSITFFNTSRKGCHRVSI